MRYLRKSKDRGYADHGWLKSYHTFSFADYYEPEFMGFGSLRVINDDFLQAGTGFPLHGHRNMEIVTLVLEGSIEHKDILGNEEVVPYGHIQRMSAGSGIRHSEYNPSKTEDLKLLQIWIEPDKDEVKPRYDRKDLTNEHKTLGLKTIVSGFNEPNILDIHQKARIHHGLFEANKAESITLTPENKYWFQIIKGDLVTDQLQISAGDGLAITGESLFLFTTKTLTEFYLFEMSS